MSATSPIWHKYSRSEGRITAYNQPWPNQPQPLGSPSDEIFLVVVPDPEPEGFDSATQELIPEEEPLPDSLQCLIHWRVVAKQS